MLLPYHQKAQIHQAEHSSQGGRGTSSSYYKAWKSKNININKNKYIQEYMSNTKKELMLAKIYDFNSVLGRIAAFVYLKLRRGY